MALNGRSNWLDGYRARVRALRNGTASFNDDPVEQANRAMYGYEDTLRSHEQWNREAQKRFVEDVENIGRIQGLAANSLALDAQRRTHESGIAKTNFMNEADVRSRQLGLDRDERLHESGIASQLSKNEREEYENRLAMMVARQGLDIFKRQVDEDAIAKKSVAYEALGQVLSGMRVNRETIDKLNEIRSEQYDDYDSKIDDYKSIRRGSNGQIEITYADGEVGPWQDYRTLASFGRLNPDLADAVEINLPENVAQQYRLDRAMQAERENQERQQAHQDRTQRRQELAAYTQNMRALITQYDKQLENARDETTRKNITAQRDEAYANLGKALKAYERDNEDIFGKQEDGGDNVANNPLADANAENGFYGQGITTFDPSSK